MSTTSSAPYGEWKPASAPFAIRYSHSLLQKIDFFVGDAYRRIPHGGLEVGGLLYGQFDAGALTLAGYQPIDCRHSNGPSFVLSDEDVERLRSQIRAPFWEDGKVQTVAGWFISHCRSELAITPQEMDLFAELLPGPHCVTMLVKPEKFKATQYGFIPRSPEGKLIDRRCRDPFVLPLTVRAEGPGAETAPERPRPVRGRSRRAESVAPAGPTEPAEMAARAEGAGATSTAATLGEQGRRQAAEGSTAPQTAFDANQPTVTRAGDEPTRSGERDRAELGSLVKKAAAEEDERDEFEEIEPPTFGMPKAAPRLLAKRVLVEASAVALAILFALAAVWTYFNFLLSPIRLATEEREGWKLAVRWPAEATAGAEGPRLRVWVEGEPYTRVLTADELERGEAVLSRSGTDMTVQLEVRHWFYDRSGLVRWIQIPSVKPAPVERGGGQPATHRASSNNGAKRAVVRQARHNGILPVRGRHATAALLIGVHAQRKLATTCAELQGIFRASDRPA